MITFRRSWKPDEEKLRIMVLNGMFIEDIAQILERTEMSCMAKAHCMGLPPIKRGKQHKIPSQTDVMPAKPIAVLHHSDGRRVDYGRRG